MARFEHWYGKELSGLVKQIKHPGMLFKGDNQANLIGVQVFKDGKPYDLSGDATVRIVRADGTLITVTGTINKSRAYAILPANAYAVSGDLHISLSVSENNKVTTLLNLLMCVYP